MITRRAWNLFPLVLLLAGVLIYGRSLSGPFLNWDDNIYVTGSLAVQNLSWESVRIAFSDVQFTDYSPLNTLGLALQQSIWHGWAGGFRLTNLFLHVVNASLVFALLSFLLNRRIIAAIGAFIFLCHPAQVEVVAWISQHKTLLSSAFIFSALYAHMRGSARFIVVFFSIAAMLTKSQAVILPLMLIASDILIERRRPLRAAADEVSLVIFAVAIAAANMLTQDLRGAIQPPHGGILPHLWGIAQLPGRYAVKLFAPYDLCALYNIDHKALSSVFFVVATALLAGLTVFFIRRSKRIATLGLLWFFLALLPVINIVPMVIWMADRYLYVPMLGALIALGAAMPRDASLKVKILISIVALVAILTLGVTSSVKSRLWTSDLLLWSDVWRRAPGMVAGTNLAAALVARDRIEDALPFSGWVIALAPERARGWAIRGEIKRRGGFFAEAAEDFAMAYRLDPKNKVYREAYEYCLGRLKGGLGAPLEGSR